MRSRPTLYLMSLLLFASGCSSTEPLEERIREMTWRLDASEQAAEQATIDKSLAEREVDLSKKQGQVYQERLALAYDALREARAQLDEGLQDRITQLSESDGGQKFAISQYGGVVLESGIFFRPGSHELTPAGQSALRPLVSTLLKSEYEGYEVELAGHTDSDPIRRSKGKYVDNWDLGAMRANSVRRFLSENGVPAEKTTISSWGPARPLAPGDKAKNRRVEIVLHPKADAESLPASAPGERAE